MRRRLVLLFALSVSLSVSAARGDDSINRLGRYWGFGWGDGYHARCTWPLSTGPSFQSASARPMPAPAPEAKPPQTEEPNSPSDRVPEQTSMRRYPKKTR
jgi:hypothetical protein